MATNLFEELKQALTTFKDFLHGNVGVIKPAIDALKLAGVQQISELIDKLIELMGKLKTEIDKLDPGAIPGLDKVSEFTTGVTSLLTTAKNLLPNEAGTIDDVLAVTDVVSSLPSLEQVKTEIIALLDAIIADLNQLK
jgi:hypothetical protein